MWAATFELNAWDSANPDTVKNGNGLYLNSHPNSTIGKYHYYLLLGDLNSSYISFDANGNIGIKANSFYLTETLGGSNLLK